MTFEEAVTLKKSLRSSKYYSSKGHILNIIIAPADEEMLGLWKKHLRHEYYSGRNRDNMAKLFESEKGFTLFGIREIELYVFAGGLLDLNEHPELLQN